MLRLRAGLDKKAEKILEAAARRIEARAKELAPVDTGTLKSSLHVSQERPLERTIADGVEYGVFQEFGTRRMGARPFLTPAVEMERKGLMDAWKELCS